MTRTGPNKATTDTVWTRDDHCCVRCGKPLRRDVFGTWSLQHRLPRGRGGDNRLSNLALACGSATTGCHGWMESQRLAAYDAGYLIRTGHDPATVPMRHWLLGLVTLTDEGTYSPAVDAA